MTIRADGSNLFVQTLTADVVPNPWNRPIKRKLRSREKMGHGQNLRRLVAKTLEGGLRHQSCTQRGFVHPHEKLPGVVGAALEGPLDPLVNGHLSIGIRGGGVLLPQCFGDEVSGIPGKHGQNENASRHLRRCRFDAKVITDLEHLQKFRDGVTHVSLVLHLLSLHDARQGYPSHPEVMIPRNIEDPSELALQHGQREAQLRQAVSQVAGQHQHVVAEEGG
mmetsp:Transcript_49045/g.106725  ORF Transcript_49045/g.106725 Transcript_49045/m.106725 type:complete len:221 (-) Transcript_49045:184-846(-)